jgi:hypothetical protein
MALIPTGNPMALVGYYLGVGSLIPILGLALSPFAIICGIIGAVKANSNPQAAGMGHAITAIVLGLFGQLIWVALYFILVAAGVLR